MLRFLVTFQWQGISSVSSLQMSRFASPIKSGRQGLVDTIAEIAYKHKCIFIYCRGIIAS